LGSNGSFFVDFKAGIGGANRIAILIPPRIDGAEPRVRVGLSIPVRKSIMVTSPCAAPLVAAAAPLSVIPGRPERPDPESRND